MPLFPEVLQILKAFWCANVILLAVFVRSSAATPRRIGVSMCSIHVIFFLATFVLPKNMHTLFSIPTATHTKEWMTLKTHQGAAYACIALFYTIYTLISYIRGTFCMPILFLYICIQYTLLQLFLCWTIAAQCLCFIFYTLYTHYIHTYINLYPCI